MEITMPATPTVGSIVHYVSYGTPGGEYPSVCRAAIVAKIGPHYEPSGNSVVGLCVLNPSGIFFDDDVEYSEQEHHGGTWHWLERVSAGAGGSGPIVVNVQP